MARATSARWGSPFQVVRPSGPYAELDRRGAWRPAVIVESEAVLRAWYSGHDGATGRILGAVQRPRQGWDRRGVSVDAGLAGVSDAAGVEDPSVVRTAGGYLMAYSGSDGTTTRTHLAASEDGEEWKAAGAVHVRGGRRSPARCPCLVAVGDRLWLYEAAEGVDGRPAIMVATTLDASDAGGWEHVGVAVAPRVDERGLTEPWVVVEDGTATMFLVSHDAEDRTAIEVAFSTDQVTWRRRPGPVGVERRHYDRGVIGRPSAARLPTGNLRLWYAATTEGDDSGACRLWSTDLRHGASP
jgi:predicted GH43/DUF377 family glycosyl hydrolase